MAQLVFRFLFLLVDIVGNISLLSMPQPLILADLQLDHTQAVVAFNAAMMLVIYIVDFIIVKTQRLLIDIEVGEGITHHKRG
jgi:hypothetical protein